MNRAEIYRYRAVSLLIRLNAGRVTASHSILRKSSRPAARRHASRSEDLKGKVVVIDCWATWCSPCMALMPELKAFYEKWHQQGLEIVGVSLDRDVEAVQRICKSKGLTWPQVIVPDNEKVRALWQEASGISGIPRVLLLDQRGILQADSTGTLEERIGRLLGDSSGNRLSKPKP